MNNIFNQDFQDLIQELNFNNVEYILVGGYAVILHGYFRTTGDMDLWIRPTKENYSRMTKAFAQFGLPTKAIDLNDFLNTTDFDVFTFGLPPISVDIMTKVKGLNFEDCYTRAEEYKIESNFTVTVLSFDDLITAKKKAARFKDYADIENLMQEE